MDTRKDQSSVGENAKYEYYAFISYKHAIATTGQFENDSAWANALDQELRYLHIPTELDRTALIHEDDDAVDPVFKDTSSLYIVRGGELEKELTEKLKKSMTLVLILSKDMVKDQNERYHPDPKKSTAWIYWEVKTFLKYHDYDWSRVIPVYIDSDDYSPQILNSSIGIERHYDNIEKPYHDYRLQNDWINEKRIFYQKTAAAIASSIFKIEKGAFWNIKEKANQALEAERKRAKSQRRLWRVIAYFVAMLAATAYILMRQSNARDYLNEARQALESGNRLEAHQLARKACKSWLWTKGAAEMIWASQDSTISCLQVNSRVCLDNEMKTVSYLEKNQEIVFMDTETFEEKERIFIGSAQDFIVSGDGKIIACFSYFNQHMQIDFHDRQSGENWSETHATPFYTDDAVINNEGDILSLNGTQAYVRGKGLVYLHPGHKHGDDDGYLDRKLSSASFMGRDSVLAVAGEISWSKGKCWTLDFYNLRSISGNSAEPFASYTLDDNTDNCFISPHQPYLYISTKDSLYAYSIMQDAHYSIPKVRADAAPSGVDEIRFSRESSMEKVDLVIDKSGIGRMFYISGGGISNGKQIIGFNESYLDRVTSEGRPITLSGFMDKYGGPYILRYVDMVDGVNVKDAYQGFHIPPVTNGERLDGFSLKDLTVITVSNKNQYIDSNGCFSYLFHGGDNRKVSFFTLAPRFFSSDYVAHSSFDLFVKGNARSYSSALYHPKTDKFVLNISQQEDGSMRQVAPHEFLMSAHWLAAIMNHSDGSLSLRLFNLENNTMRGEIPLAGAPNSTHLLKWMHEDVLLLSTSDGLCKVDMRFPGSISCDTIDDSFSQRSHNFNAVASNDVFEYYRTPAFTTNRTWFIYPSGQFIMPDKDRYDSIMRNISEKGQYYSSYDPDSQQLSFISTISADTLKTLRTKPGNGYWQKFSPDDRFFLYATDENEICCLSLPSFQTIWFRQIHVPFSSLIGKKYAILASTSIFVISLKNGNVVAEFPNYPMKEQVLKMSPNENYLLCGESLYSIPGRQKLADGFSGECIALENDHIVFSNYMMELPKLPRLVDLWKP